jgi:hypothetical protein
MTRKKTSHLARLVLTWVNTLATHTHPFLWSYTNVEDDSFYDI